MSKVTWLGVRLKTLNLAPSRWRLRSSSEGKAMGRTVLILWGSCSGVGMGTRVLLVGAEFFQTRAGR